MSESQSPTSAAPAATADDAGTGGLTVKERLKKWQQLDSSSTSTSPSAATNSAGSHHRSRQSSHGIKDAFLANLQRSQREREEEERRKRETEQKEELELARKAAQSAKDALSVIAESPISPKHYEESKEETVPDIICASTSAVDAPSGDGSGSDCVSDSDNAEVKRPPTAPTRPPSISIAPIISVIMIKQASDAATVTVAADSPSSSMSVPVSPSMFDLDSPSFTLTPSPMMQPQLSPLSSPPPLPPRRSESPRPPAVSAEPVTPTPSATMLPPPIPEHLRSRSLSSPLQPPPTPSQPAQPLTPTLQQCFASSASLAHAIHHSHSQSLALSPAQAQSLAVTDPSIPAGEHDPTRRARIEAELLSTEQSYVDSLNILITEFYQPLRAMDIVPLGDLQAIFINVEIICNFHSVFLSDLKNDSKMISDSFLNLSDYMKLYSNYLNGYSQAMKCLEKHRKNNKLQSFLSKHSSKLDLCSYLIMPVQRIPRYELLLRELLRFTPDEHSERVNLCKALMKIKNIASFINEAKREMENQSRVMTLCNTIIGDIPSDIMARKLIREGTLSTLKIAQISNENYANKVKQKKLYVFDTFVLYTNDTNKLRGNLSIDSITVERVDVRGKLLGFRFVSLSGGSDEENLVWLCDSEAESEVWYRELVAQIEKRNPNHSSVQPSGGRLTRSASMMIAPVSTKKDDAIVANNTRRLRNGTNRDAHSKIMNSLKTLRGSTIATVQTLVKDSASGDDNTDGSSMSMSAIDGDRESEEAVRIE